MGQPERKLIVESDLGELVGVGDFRAVVLYKSFPHTFVIKVPAWEMAEADEVTVQRIRESMSANYGTDDMARYDYDGWQRLSRVLPENMREFFAPVLTIHNFRYSGDAIVQPLIHDMNMEPSRNLRTAETDLAHNIAFQRRLELLQKGLADIGLKYDAMRRRHILAQEFEPGSFCPVVVNPRELYKIMS
ncbi:MAG: hypothetical protein ABIA93_02875 [Candidatus Woesearchaeota archaeon]